MSILSLVAPFCGPTTRVAPFFRARDSLRRPQQRFSTVEGSRAGAISNLQATRLRYRSWIRVSFASSLHRPSVPSYPKKNRKPQGARHASRRRLSRCRKTDDDFIRAPTRASKIISPTPNVVARTGSRSLSKPTHPRRFAHFHYASFPFSIHAYGFRFRGPADRVLCIEPGTAGALQITSAVSSAPVCHRHHFDFASGSVRRSLSHAFRRPRAR